MNIITYVIWKTLSRYDISFVSKNWRNNIHSQCTIMAPYPSDANHAMIGTYCKTSNANVYLLWDAFRVYSPSMVTLCNSKHGIYGFSHGNEFPRADATVRLPRTLRIGIAYSPCRHLSVSIYYNANLKRRGAINYSFAIRWSVRDVLHQPSMFSRDKINDWTLVWFSLTIGRGKNWTVSECCRSCWQWSFSN